MRRAFTSLYDYFNSRKPILFGIWIATFLVCGYFASKLELRESILDMLPRSEKTAGLHSFLQQGQIADRVVIMVSSSDSTEESLLSVAAVMDSIGEDIRIDAKEFVDEIEWRANDSIMDAVMNAVNDHLPVFLDSSDYVQIDSMIQRNAIQNRIHENYKLLSGPAGFGVKSFIIEDPLFIRNLAFQKFIAFQSEEGVVLKDGYFFSKSDNTGLIFIQPKFLSADTRSNLEFKKVLDRLTSTYTSSSINVDYFGAPFVAAGNAQQIKSDMWVTITLMLILIVAILGFYFRVWHVPLLVLIPVCMGALFGMACLYWFKGSISIIALGSGSLILGIAVNYSLHFLTDYKFHPNVREVIGNLAFPLTMGSLTTVAGFLSLRWVHAGVLQDLGLFAACSLVGAALTTLIFLPHVMPRGLKSSDSDLFQMPSFVGKPKYRFIFILLLTPFLFYFAKKVGFDANLNNLNFIDQRMSEAEKKAQSLSPAFSRSIFILSQDSNVDQALHEAAKAKKVIDTLMDVDQSASVVSILPSTTEQEARLKAWKLYWANQPLDSIRSNLVKSGNDVGFNPEVFDQFDTLIQHTYTSIDPNLESQLSMLTDPFISKGEDGYTVMQIVHTSSGNGNSVIQALTPHPKTLVFDRQGVTGQMMEWVRKDFTFITWVTSILVFVALLLIYGRIELALITFIPMVISWIWILGIMGLFNVQFNMVNVILSTFIFALGDDFCIFTTDGLQKKYTYGKEQSRSVSVSIALSAITTMIGLGVLIFAKHPALRSIAGVSLIGIGCVWFISQTVQPVLFNYFITRPANARHTPFTFLGLIKSIFAFTYFFLNSIITGIIGYVGLKLIPGNNPKRQFRYHQLLSASNWSLIHIMANLKKRVIGKTNETYRKPSVIIANHSSFLDILLITMMHPRTILLTNEWTWKSPVFGLAIRLAEYYPVRSGIDDIIPQLKKKVDLGYSIAVFPEGTRSVDGSVHRFHKGAFFIAEELGLDIQPVVIHNANEMMMKGFFYLNDGPLSVKYLPRVGADDPSFGTTLKEKAKSYRQYIEREIENLDQQILTPDTWKDKLISNYLYKGPVLEWYLRVKLRLEKNYKLFNALIPRNASVVDLGCGYGFLPYMLMLTSKYRSIIGVDYDEEKIEVARNGYLKNERVDFHHADITKYSIPETDVVILSDVLHYLTDVQKSDVCRRAIEAIRKEGMLIIRDGMKNEEQRHKKTLLSEWLSTKIIRFNKVTEEGLSFVSEAWVNDFARTHDLRFEKIEDSRLTSNTIFVFHIQ